MDWKEILPELKKVYNRIWCTYISAIAILVIGFWIAKIFTKILKKY